MIRKSETHNLNLLLRYILMVFLAFQSIFTFAQNERILKGTIYEIDKNTPSIGATVTLVNENDRILGGTVTGADGKFSIAMPKSAVRITFSFLGMKEVTKELTDIPESYEIVLQLDGEVLGSSTVVAEKHPNAELGFLTIKKDEIASAVSTVSVTDLTPGASSSIDQMLQGAVAGLQVVSASGDPGAAATIRIRGVSTISGVSDPLWIIDGAEVISDNYNVESISDFGYSPIGDIDPQDIESISVLKDASATALYGSRGANGVIVINTKRGTKSKPIYSFSSRIVETFAPKRIPLLSGDEQRIFLIEAKANADGGDDGLFLPMLRGDMSRADAWKFNNNTDWVDAITENGLSQEYNFNIKGGGKRLSYYWGTGYNIQYGTTKGTGYDRFNTRFNLDYRISEKLKVSAQMSYSHSYTDKRGSDHPNARNPIADAHKRSAFFPIYEPSGEEYYVDRSEDALNASSTARYNPLALIDYSTYFSQANRFNSSVSLDFNILKNLTFRTQFSTDFRQNGDEYFLPAYATDAKMGENEYNQGRGTDGFNIQMVSNSRLNWNIFNNETHNLMFSGIFNYRTNRHENVSVSYNNTGSPDFNIPNNAAELRSGTGSFGKSKSLGLIGNLHYVLLDRYIVTLTAKSEGDSKYGGNNEYTIYPSVGLSWKMQNEPWLKNVKWINELHPRFSYGETGNMPGDRNMKTITYNTETGYLGNIISFPASFAYDNILPEKSRDFNYGLTFSLFNNRLSAQMDYYTRTTTDLLFSVKNSSSIGFNSQRKNFGTLKNSGFELGLTAQILERSDKHPSWKTSFNISTNKNILLKMAESYDGGYDQNRNGYKSRLIEGRAIGGFYGLKALGVYATDDDAILKDDKGNIIYEWDGVTPKYMHYGDENGHQFRGGDMIYEDVNKDGIINDLDIVQIGDGNPIFFGGWNNSLGWKNWMLTFNFTYQYGNDVINQSRRNLENMTGTSNYARSVTKRWRAQGDITEMPRAERGASWNEVASSRFVEDASYLRLKHIALSYNFTSNDLKKIGLGAIKGINATLSATNIYTWTKYLGVDPEVPLGGSTVMFGIDYGTTAPPLSCSFQLRVTF